jgi:hypothetical protein
VPGVTLAALRRRLTRRAEHGLPRRWSTRSAVGSPSIPGRVPVRSDQSPRAKSGQASYADRKARPPSHRTAGIGLRDAQVERQQIAWTLSVGALRNSTSQGSRRCNGTTSCVRSPGRFIRVDSIRSRTPPLEHSRNPETNPAARIFGGRILVMGTPVINAHADLAAADERWDVRRGQT